MKTATTTYNPHKWFFAYIKNLEGYNKEFEKAIREGIIYEHSRGRTISLSEFYELDRSAYFSMKNQLQGTQNSEMSQARKRVIAVLFSYLRFIGYNPDMNYIRETARKAAKARSFNMIPIEKLRQLYRIFGEKYKKQSTEWSEELLTQISEDLDNETANN